MKLKDIPIGGRFRISKNGVLWEKVNNQGMDGRASTIKNVIPAPNRKNHKGIKFKVVFNSINVIQENGQ